MPVTLFDEKAIHSYGSNAVRDKNVCHVVCLIGLGGNGKSTLGKAVTRYLGAEVAEFFEGDSVLTPAMQSRVDNCGSFGITPGMVEDYMQDAFIPAVVQKARQCQKPFLFVAQAIYRNAHRLQLQNALGGKEKVTFWVVSTPREVQQAQLETRDCGCCWKFNAKATNHCFELPDDKQFNWNEIKNPGKGHDKDILNQLRQLSLFQNAEKQRRQNNAEKFSLNSVAEEESPTLLRKNSIWNTVADMAAIVTGMNGAAVLAHFRPDAK